MITPDERKRCLVWTCFRRHLVLVLCLGLSGLSGNSVLYAKDPEQPRGLPFIRTYPLDEIGRVPSGLRLGFDSFGRLAVTYDGVYEVLNDAAWVSRLDASSVSNVRMSSVSVVDGVYYYGGRGSWGTAVLTPEGQLKAVPQVSQNAPKWTAVSPFNKVLKTATGIYFYEINGLVKWDYQQKKNLFYEMPRAGAAFTVGKRVFVSCQNSEIHELSSVDGTSTIREYSGLEKQNITMAAPLDDSHTLLAGRDGSLLVFDGEKAIPWAPQTRYFLSGRITAMESLLDGGVAIAIASKGLYLFTQEGTLNWSLELPEFRRIETMATQESGVLWVAGGNAVHRVLYDAPLTSFGQAVGVTDIWPLVALWNEKTLICSNNTLYEMEPTQPGRLPQYRVLVGSPTRQADFLATSGSLLLIGNPKGVFSVDEVGTLTQLIALDNVAGLNFITPDTCLAIGSKEIAAIHFKDGLWAECASRIKGVGDAPIKLHKLKDLWIELGGDQVARLSLHEGKLAFEPIIPPWSGAQWTNIGIAFNRIILSAAKGQRVFYDPEARRFVEEPRLETLLNRSPYWLSRITEDESKILWATHDHGLVTFTPKGEDYEVDASTYEMLNDSYPTVTILPGNNTWVGASRALYHVERESSLKSRAQKPRLVSLVADQEKKEFIGPKGDLPAVSTFSYNNNSLSFLFFSGTYAWRYPPRYEYRLGSGETWLPVDPSSALRLPKLRDGAYQLEVRRSAPHDSHSQPIAFAFEIKPPWFRAPLAYFLYLALLVLAFFGTVRWMNQRSLKRNSILEELVQQRTAELEDTMLKLGAESKNAATLAERSRLAGEIHDSVQQGISGVILHMDTTLTDQRTTPWLQAELTTMRNMLSYSREEVQQAVWNLESPLLQNATLPQALRKLAGYINAGGAKIVVKTEDEPAGLEAKLQHNLLRIAQEAITNAVKHAEASKIEVTLQLCESGVSLVILDDGKGFLVSENSTAKGHFGLRGQRARAKAIGAELQVISSPGAGTQVSVLAPLKERLPRGAQKEI